MRLLLWAACLAGITACDSESPRENGVAYAVTDPSGITKLYASNLLKVAMEVPREWQPSREEGVEQGAKDAKGYVKLTALGGAETIKSACKAEAYHRMRPYGENPRVESIRIDGQPACRITPTDGYAVQKRIPAGIVALYPKPLDIPGPAHPRDYAFLVVWTDPPHLRMIERSLRFVR